MGIGEIPITILARWSEKQMIHYIRDAPLARITEKYKNCAQGGCGSSSNASPNFNFGGSNTTDAKTLSDIKKQCEQMADTIRVQQKQIQELIKVQSAAQKAYYIHNLNEKRGKIHMSCSCMDDTSENWVTLCGWSFAKWKFRKTFTIDEESQLNLCETCVNTNACRKFDEDASDSSSSASQ